MELVSTPLLPEGYTVPASRNERIVSGAPGTGSSPVHTTPSRSRTKRWNACASSMSPPPWMRICARLHGDAARCVYGLNVQNLATSSGARRVKLIRDCAILPVSARNRCYEWLGTALAVVTNGRFGQLGCGWLAVTGRKLCFDGAERMNRALVTFS